MFIALFIVSTIMAILMLDVIEFTRAGFEEPYSFDTYSFGSFR
jgi:hypothetical protein